MNINEMFPAKYCGGRHLPPAGVLVELINAGPEDMRAGPSKPVEKGFVLYVKRVAGPQVAGVRIAAGGMFGVVLRKKLAEQIAFIVGSPETNDWKGKRVVLYPCQSKAAGEIVMSVCARPPKAQDKPAQEPTQEPPAQESAPSPQGDADAATKAQGEPTQPPPAESSPDKAPEKAPEKDSAWRLIDYRTNAEQWVRDNVYPSRNDMRRHYAKLINTNILRGDPAGDVEAWSDEWINPTIANKIKALADALMNAPATSAKKP